MPEVRFVRRVSMRNSVHLMTASAKEVISDAIHLPAPASDEYADAIRPLSIPLGMWSCRRADRGHACGKMHA